MPHALTRRSTTGLLLLALGAGTFALPASAVPAQPLSTVLVTAATGGAAAAAAAVQAAGGTVLHRLTLIGGVSAELPAGTVLAPAYRVVPNAPLRVAKADTPDAAPPVTVRQTVGLPAAGGAEGSGVTVAVVDTGVADVPELAGRLTHVDATAKSKDTRDGYGHGTFVAGLVAGSGQYAGIAPGAKLLDVRVADKDGKTDLVTVLTGLELVDPTQVGVLNLSLSSGSDLPYQIDPLSQALEALWRRGVLVVVPAGNDGPGAGTISSPGTDPVLLTVGGVDEAGTANRADDVVSDFSARGPAPQGVAKPDLVAPASHLVSLRAPDSKVDRTNKNSRVGDDYFRGSGTSFSTAVVSGAAAVLAAEHPGATPAQLKALLTGTAYAANGLSDPAAAGAGGLDLAAARQAAVPSASTPDAAAVPGDPGAWDAFVTALLQGDRKQAANAWSALSVEARNWAASSWSSLTPQGRNWAARNWAGRNWAGADGTAAEWDARNWAARNWAARNWAGRNWAGRNWAGRNWADASWSKADWAGRNWSARNWAGNWS